MFRLLRLLFASALFIVFLTPSWALAQSSVGPWTEPLNLSHSGVATHPGLVVDSQGVLHAVWRDHLSNYLYTRFDGDQWTAPEMTDLNRLFQMPSPGTPADPLQLANYTGPNPLFIASPNQRIFAFWINSEGRVFVSSVENENFQDDGLWGSRHLVTLGAASFAAAVDARGELHVAFLRPEETRANPSGIYYTHSKNGGDWTAPVLLYESSYLRRLEEGEANLSLTTAGTEEAPRVFVAWDNRPRRQVFLAQSADGGKSWVPAALIAGPAPDSAGAGPFDINVGVHQDSIVLVWQSGQPESACRQIYQISRDAGATWSDPQPMIGDLLGCAESTEFVTGLPNSSEEPLYLLTETKSQDFLASWNGHQWSPPEIQPILSGFTEPEIYTEVLYGCHQAALLGERLYIVGCDEGEGRDVWVTSRNLASNTSLSGPPTWSQLSPITNDNLEMEAVELVASDDGSIHAFISQNQDPAIYYTDWDGELWSRLSPVLELPEGDAGWPALAAGPGNELFLIVPNNRGSLYFSRAISGRAGIGSSWSTPTQLEISHDGQIGSVDVVWDAAGTVSVAYSVPVNDQRGIYLVRSKDQGTTWSEPLQVFDGAAAGFDFVGTPSLLTSASGVLHLIWKVQAIQGDGVPEPLSLYYTRTEDGGHTFNDAELVVEEPVGWREIVTDGKGNLHLLWQPHHTLTNVWDQVSLDGGHTWEHAHGLPDERKLTAVTRDPAGRLHLLGIGPEGLGHWLWDGDRWNSEAPVGGSFSSQPKNPVDLLAAAVNKQGKMILLLAKSTGEGDGSAKTLLYSSLALQLPRKQPATQEAPTQTPLPPTLTPATLTPQPLSTPTRMVDSAPTSTPDKADGNGTNNRMTPLILVLLPVALLLLTVLGIVIQRANRIEDQ